MPTRLRVADELGRGGTARVWRARDLVAGVDVVVKVISAPGAGARLEREARALARLRDVPGVVHVRDLGLTPEGTAWIVADLAPGGSLADRVADRDWSTGADTPDPRRLLGELASTLAAAHEQKVVHGDISPANVLFGADGTALLADFGAADLDGVSDTVLQGLTPVHAAPERRRGAPASPAGDVYSMGSTVRAVLPAASPRPAGALPVTPSDDVELLELLDRCTSELPTRRPTAHEVVLALCVAPEPARRRFGRGRSTRSRR